MVAHVGLSVASKDTEGGLWPLRECSVPTPPHQPSASDTDSQRDTAHPSVEHSGLYGVLLGTVLSQCTALRHSNYLPKQFTEES